MKKITVLLTTIVFMSVFIGCRKDEFTTSELPEQVSLQQKDEFAFKDGQMILGEKLENPYSVENMQIAYNNLRVENKLKSEMNIETTHYYVRFRPKSMQELDIITRDTTLDFFDYPLDVEIKRGGTFYHDPSIPKNEITWQYTVVPVNYVFSKVQYQKLANLYLPEEGGELRELKSGSIEHFDWLQLESEALKITNNIDTVDTYNNRLKSTSWVPKGTIKVWDDVLTKNYSTAKQIFLYYNYYNGFNEEIITQLEDSIDNHVYAEDILPQLPINIADYIQGVFDERGNPSNHYEQWDIMEEIIEDSREPVYTYEINTTNSHFIPLEGIEVRANRWFTTHTGFTDANGNFTCDGTFDRPANYSIKWERYNYDIREEDWGQAYYNGPKFEGDWNLNIDTGKSLRYATIHRAAYIYYYKNPVGIKTPPQNDWYSRKLKIGYYHRMANDEINGDANPYWPQWYTWPDLRIFGENSSGWRNTRDIFSTTIHELAHASHWDLSGNVTFIATSTIVAESWARGVQWAITQTIYSGYIPDYRIGDYTGIVQDLVDGTGGAGSYDQVSGYTMNQIEQAVNGAKTWDDWKNNLKNNYTNGTENQLDNLFNHWD